jgi:probable blue pigment (indigoidine) exporter
MRQLLPGLLFAALWASASVATKVGIHYADPFLLANTRFMLAGGMMLVYARLSSRGASILPRGSEWRHLLIFALFNTTIYLGAFVMALKKVSAGIGSLSTATSPLFIMMMSAIWMKRRLKWFELAGIALALSGVVVATYPLLKNSYASIDGLLILLFGMVSVSAATVYYARVTWKLPSIAINGWQVLLGGFLLLPVTLLTADFAATKWNSAFWLSVLWLVGPVSIFALQLWFFLVKKDAVRASLWLFLCPVFGFVYASVLLGEPITAYTYAGTAMVIGGLYLALNKGGANRTGR